MVLCKTIRNRAKIKYYAGVKGADAQDAEEKLEVLSKAVVEL